MTSTAQRDNRNKIPVIAQNVKSVLYSTSIPNTFVTTFTYVCPNCNGKRHRGREIHLSGRFSRVGYMKSCGWVNIEMPATF